LNNESYLVGIKKATKGKGVGSIINRVAIGETRNVSLVENENNEIYAVAEKTIKQSEELFCHYARGYKLKK
jgi:hypothetical protein